MFLPRVDRNVIKLRFISSRLFNFIIFQVVQKTTQTVVNK